MTLSHFSQPPDKALTPQLRLVPLSSIESQGHSSNSKGQGDRLAAAYLMHMDSPSAPLHNAKTQATFSALSLPQRATLPNLTWHQFHLLVAEWRFMQNLNRNASHCCRVPKPTPTLPQSAMTFSWLIKLKLNEYNICILSLHYAFIIFIVNK